MITTKRNIRECESQGNAWEYVSPHGGMHVTEDSLFRTRDDMCYADLHSNGEDNTCTLNLVVWVRRMVRSIREALCLTPRERADYERARTLHSDCMTQVMVNHGSLEFAVRDVVATVVYAKEQQAASLGVLLEEQYTEEEEDGSERGFPLVPDYCGAENETVDDDADLTEDADQAGDPIALLTACEFMLQQMYADMLDELATTLPDDRPRVRAAGEAERREAIRAFGFDTPEDFIAAREMHMAGASAPADRPGPSQDDPGVTTHPPIDAPQGVLVLPTADDGPREVEEVPTVVDRSPDPDGSGALQAAPRQARTPVLMAYYSSKLVAVIVNETRGKYGRLPHDKANLKVVDHYMRKALVKYNFPLCLVDRHVSVARLLFFSELHYDFLAGVMAEQGLVARLETARG